MKNINFIIIATLFAVGEVITSLHTSTIIVALTVTLLVYLISRFLNKVDSTSDGKYNYKCLKSYIDRVNNKGILRQRDVIWMLNKLGVRNNNANLKDVYRCIKMLGEEDCYYFLNLLVEEIEVKDSKVKNIKSKVSGTKIGKLKEIS